MYGVDPVKIKRAGSVINGYDENKWKTHASQLVEPGLLAKFSQNPGLKASLLATGTKVLAEASPHDKLWGIACGLRHENVLKQQTWKGDNIQGKLLMKIRSKLKPN